MTMQFPGLNNAPVFEKGNPLKPGTFDLEVVQVISKKTNKIGDALIVEFKILNNYGHPDHKIGDKVSWFQKLIDTNVAFPAIKAFLIATLGYDYRNQKAEVDAKIAPNLEGLLIEAIQAGNTPGKGLNGSKVHVSTFHKETKPKPVVVQTPQGPQTQMQSGTFTVHDWSLYKAPQAQPQATT